MSGFVRALVFASWSAGLLVACGDSPSDEKGGAKTTSQPARPKGANLPPEMVAAVAAGKASTTITVHFALGSAPEVNKALPVEIALVPQQDFTAVRALFKGTEGLAVTSGDKLEATASPKADSVIKHQIILLPTAEGIYMVSATVDTDSATEGGVTRVFSLPVIVAGMPPAAAPAAPAAAPTAPAAKTPAG